ncbi:MAG TPA: helix-turn-helix transcriptional regulator [Verrucomicrobiae bacterium]|nr:helix-turn-helix transcriptional regulator [Verrucomicrobiae bacterium]
MPRRKRMEQATLAPARCLAHWTFTQRTIHAVLSNKTKGLEYEKPNVTEGDLIRNARCKANLTQEQLSKKSGIPRYWLGRWERGRALPGMAEWNKLAMMLSLSAKPKESLASTC